MRYALQLPAGTLEFFQQQVDIGGFEGRVAGTQAHFDAARHLAQPDKSELKAAGLEDMGATANFVEIPGGEGANQVVQHGRRAVEIAVDDFADEIADFIAQFFQHLAVETALGLGGIAMRAAQAMRNMPFDQHLLQLIDPHRLGEVIIHTGRQASIIVALHCVGGHGDDRGTRSPFMLFLLADSGGGLETVHFWHLAIHQHQGKLLLLQHFKSFAAIGRQPHQIAQALQLAQRHILVDRIVLHQQHRLDAG
ncbi:hypothetical protein GALL_306840 [mine drainage metagenome]|uniref:Uncharacterized protein n=1 Tax=mine drainage metagenome TaxID=410659 RepID=A0A1J5QUT9_9ZZZZ